MMRASTLVLCLVFTAVTSGATQADEPDPAQLFPSSTAAFVDFSDPPAALSVILDHPLRQDVESLDAWKQAKEVICFGEWQRGKLEHGHLSK